MSWEFEQSIEAREATPHEGASLRPEEKLRGETGFGEANASSRHCSLGVEVPRWGGRGTLPPPQPRLPSAAHRVGERSNSGVIWVPLRVRIPGCMAACLGTSSGRTDRPGRPRYVAPLSLLRHNEIRHVAGGS
jgi:hypothetical protein